MEGQGSGNPARWQDEGLHAQEDDNENGSDELDDTYASSLQGSTSSESCMSVDSSVFMFEMVHGRSYHGYRRGLYPMPNDQTECNAEPHLHQIFLELLNGRLFVSDIGEAPQKIIDIGTGIGIWAIEVADQFPSASVIGTDLSPVQPTWLPPNMRFFIEDCEDSEWLHGSNFDLVHFRHAAMFMRDLDALLDKIFPHIRPGGWIELHELPARIYCDDGSLKDDDPLRLLGEITRHSFEGMGLANCLLQDLEAKLARAGFCNIQGDLWKVPTSPWPDDKELQGLGMMLKVQLMQRLSGLAAKPMAHLPRDELVDLMNGVKRSLDDKSIHAYMEFWVWRGQKPGGP